MKENTVLSIGTLVKICTVVTAFVALATILVLGFHVFLLIFAGILLAVFLRAFSSWFEKKAGLTHGWALLLVLFLIVLIVGVSGYLAAPSIAEQAQNLSRSMPQAVERVSERLGKYEWGRTLMRKAPEAGEILPPKRDVATFIQEFFRVTGGAIANIGIIIALGIFIATSAKVYINGAIALFPKDRERRMCEVMNALGDTLSHWLFGQLLSMTMIGILTALGLWALGIPMAALLGIIAGLLTFIPTLGPILSAVPAVMVAFLDGPITALWVIALYLAVQAIEGYAITPLIQRRMVHMPPALTLSAEIMFGVVFGILAFALAVPLAACLLVMIKMLYLEDVLGKETEFSRAHDDSHREHNDPP